MIKIEPKRIDYIFGLGLFGILIIIIYVNWVG